MFLFIFDSVNKFLIFFKKVLNLLCLYEIIRAKDSHHYILPNGETTMKRKLIAFSSILALVTAILLTVIPIFDIFTVNTDIASIGDTLSKGEYTSRFADDNLSGYGIRRTVNLALSAKDFIFLCEIEAFKEEIKSYEKKIEDALAKEEYNLADVYSARKWNTENDMQKKIEKYGGSDGLKKLEEKLSDEEFCSSARSAYVLYGMMFNNESSEYSRLGTTRGVREVRGVAFLITALVLLVGSLFAFLSGVIKLFPLLIYFFKNIRYISDADEFARISDKASFMMLPNAYRIVFSLLLLLFGGPGVALSGSIIPCALLVLAIPLIRIVVAALTIDDTSEIPKIIIKKGMTLISIAALIVASVSLIHLNVLYEYDKSEESLHTVYAENYAEVYLSNQTYNDPAEALERGYYSAESEFRTDLIIPIISVALLSVALLFAPFIILPRLSRFGVHRSPIWFAIILIIASLIPRLQTASSTEEWREKAVLGKYSAIYDAYLCEGTEDNIEYLTAVEKTRALSEKTELYQSEYLDASTEEEKSVALANLKNSEKALERARLVEASLKTNQKSSINLALYASIVMLVIEALYYITPDIPYSSHFSSGALTGREKDL